MDMYWKCLIGFHSYEDKSIDSATMYRECKFCGKFQYFYPYLFKWDNYDKDTYELLYNKGGWAK